MFESKTILSDAVDRAAMAGGIYPAETRAEAAIKRGLAKGLAFVANWLDPEAFDKRDASLKVALRSPE